MDFWVQRAAAASDCLCVAPFFACAMSMRTHDGRVDHGVLNVGIGRQRLKNTTSSLVD